jgi:hypothetical protein
MHMITAADVRDERDVWRALSLVLRLTGHTARDVRIERRPEVARIMAWGLRGHTAGDVRIEDRPEVARAMAITLPHVVIATSDGYTLRRVVPDMYIAGCHGPYTLAQALEHWGPPREDDRAQAFLAALLQEPAP